MAQYLNVRQRKLGTIIIQTVHILQHDNADTGSLPVEDFVKHSPTYFQIIQPGSSTVTPPYQFFTFNTYVVIWVLKVFSNFGNTVFFSQRELEVSAPEFFTLRILWLR